MTDSEITGDNQQEILTGQVPVSPACRMHRSTAHSADGTLRYCNRCGKNDEGVQFAKPNGGWA